jgi:Calcineurin-like phosphoesterase
MNRSYAIHVLTLGLAAVLTSCGQTECSTPDYSRAECRVLAENELARLRSSTGVEVRVQSANATDDRETWLAEGRVRERGDVIQVRIAHMGDFAVSLRDTTGEGQVRLLELDNVHPEATLVGSSNVVELAAAGLGRQLEITIPPNGVTWVRGSLTPVCPTRVRIAALADVQTNPGQFARIVERLQRERDFAAEAGELLVGVIFAGDLTEHSRVDEFREFEGLLEAASVPFALTPGNHDVYEPAQPSFNQFFGPGNYAFEVCGVRVAMLDTGSGALAESIIARLPELFDRRDARHMITAMHHPPYAELTGFGWSREDLASITLGEFVMQGGDLVVAGHGHLLREFADISIADGSVRELIIGTGGAVQGAGQPLYGYVRLTFVGTDVETCFVEVPPPGAVPHGNTTTTMPMCDTP